MSFIDYLTNTLKLATGAMYPNSPAGSDLQTSGIRSLIRGVGQHPLIDAQGTLDRLTNSVPGFNNTPPPVQQAPADLSGFFNPWGGSDSGSQNSTQQILQQLQALQDPSRYMSSPDQLRAQAQAQAAAQYGPVIAALQSQQQAARTRGERNQATVGSMFNQLSDSISADIPKVQQNYDQTAQNSQQQYNQLQASITGQYQKSQQEQEDMYKRLNIQAAAPEVLSKQQENRDFFNNMAKTNAQTQQDALSQEKQGAVDYTRSSASGARSEGTQRVADLASALSDLMNQFDSQIGANQAAEAQSAAALLGQLTSQNQSSALQRAQNDFNNYIASVNLGRSLDNDQLSNMLKMQQYQQGQQKLGNSPVKSLSDVAAQAMGMGLGQQSAQRLQNVFSSAVLSDPIIQQGLDPISSAPATPEAKAASIVEAGRNAGLSQAELNVLQNMALQYFGRS